MTTRFFLGLFEAGMFPGCKFARCAKQRTKARGLIFILGFYLLGMWYTRTEAQKRFSFFFSSTTLAGAFGGLLAYGIAQMDGVRGYMGWRWVFIIEGLITSVVAMILFFFISDFPEEVKWLTDEEREFVRAKLARDVGKSAHTTKIGTRQVLEVFKDCKSTTRVLASCLYTC